MIEGATKGVRKMSVGLFVDPSRPQHWIVRDPDGNFWALPPIANSWNHRQAFSPTDETKLNPVPGHYKYLLDLPF